MQTRQDQLRTIAKLWNAMEPKEVATITGQPIDKVYSDANALRKKGLPLVRRFNPRLKKIYTSEFLEELRQLVK